MLLWELATLAQQPYAEVDPFEMAEYLRDGYRLVQPINCPDELYVESCLKNETPSKIVILQIFCDGLLLVVNARGKTDIPAAAALFAGILHGARQIRLRKITQSASTARLVIQSHQM